MNPSESLTPLEPLITASPAIQASAPIKKTTFSQKLKSLILKIWSFTKWIFRVLLNLALFIANPAFYVIGFGAGIVLMEHMKAGIERIKAVFNKQQFASLVILGIGAFFSLPIALAASAFFFGGDTGIRMTKEAII